MTYPLVAELADAGIPVTVSCRVLKLARQPYYRWRGAVDGQLKAGTRLIFETDQGHPVTPWSFRSRLSREIRGLELDRTVTPHDLRDTAASAICQALVERHGVHAGLTEAARFLGHAGVTKALLAYVADRAVTVDQSAITDALDPRARREAARRGTVDALTRAFDGQVAVAGPAGFHVKVLAQHLDAMRAAVEGLDFPVGVSELSPDEVLF